MKLNILERIKLLEMLPTENNFATLRIVRQLQDALSPSEEEYKEFEIKLVEEDGKKFTTWNEKGAEGKEIVIGEKATDIIIEALKKLDEQKKLTNQHVSLYEKFIGA